MARVGHIAADVTVGMEESDAPARSATEAAPIAGAPEVTHAEEEESFANGDVWEAREAESDAVTRFYTEADYTETCR